MHPLLVGFGLGFVFAAASTAGAADGKGATVLLVLGVGTLTWFTTLSCALAVALEWRTLASE